MSEFSDKEQKLLLSTGHVVSITKTNVTFTTEFKVKAVELSFDGVPPSKVFTQLGIDICLFQDDYPKKSISRWKKIFLAEGKEGLEEKRGKNSTGRPKRSSDPSDLRALQARIAHLEAENYILKKLNALAAKSEKKKGLK